MCTLSNSARHILIMYSPFSFWHFTEITSSYSSAVWSTAFLTSTFVSLSFFLLSFPFFSYWLWCGLDEGSQMKWKEGMRRRIHAHCGLNARLILPNNNIQKKKRKKPVTISRFMAYPYHEHKHTNTLLQKSTQNFHIRPNSVENYCLFRIALKSADRFCSVFCYFLIYFFLLLATSFFLLNYGVFFNGNRTTTTFHINKK